jgi:endonuclease VIII-like 1
LKSPCACLNARNYFAKRDISEVLLEQKYFNGIGNYLRAEILYRAKILPSRNSYDILSDSNNFQVISNLCKSVAEEAIYLGGGQIKNWKNPFGKEKINFSNWLKVYGRGESYFDKTKRRIWFNSEIQK